MKASNKKVPRFPLARGVFVLTAAASAVVGVVGWLSAEITPATVILAVFCGLSAVVVPASLENVGRSWLGVVLVLPAIVFGAINAYSFHNAVDVLVEQPHVETYKADHASTVAAYEQARQAVLDHKLPAFPADMIAPRVRDNTKAWEVAHAALVAAEASTKAAVDAIPAYQPTIDPIALIVVSGLLDLSLSVGLAGLSLIRHSIERKQKKERDEDRIKRKAAKAAQEAELVAQEAAKAVAAARAQRKAAKKAQATVSDAERATLLAARGAHLTVVR